MLIGFAKNGFTDTSIVVREMTVDQLFDRLGRPTVGPKNGSYYVRGGNFRELKRSDENMIDAELLIIDGDSSIDPETGEITSGAPPIHDIHATLTKLGISHFVHTSHSYKNDGVVPFWKYRAVIPCKIKNQNELDIGVSYIITKLHENSIWISDVSENHRFSQPWFLPRVATEEELSRFVALKFEGDTFQIETAMRWHAEQQKRIAQEQKAADRPISRIGQGDSVIERFNKANGLEWIRAQLSNMGYRFSHYDRSHDAYRYIAPASETRTAGVVVMKGKFGDWIAYSHHGGHDPLSGRVTDAFSLYAMDQHGGDLKAAVRQLNLENAGVTSSPLGLASEAAEMASGGDWPTDVILGDGSHIPPRQWIYGKHLIRKFVSCTISPGGVGKSSLSIVEALAMASGKPLLHDHVTKPYTVWLYNGEDPQDEIMRRIHAAAQHYRITQADIKGRLKADSGRDHEIIIAKRVSGECHLVEPVIEKLIQVITRDKIDVMIVDPFVSSHRVSENANEEIDRVVKAWAYIADKTGCAIELIHHSRKTNGNEVTVEDSRGASSLLAAARSARALNPMTRQEAEELGITDDRWRYFRTDNGKANLAPRSDNATWFKLATVDLQNAKGDHPSDLVGVVTKYDMPGPFANMTPDLAMEFLGKIDAGLPNGERYAHGKRISVDMETSAVGLLIEVAEVTEGEAKRMVEAWLNMRKLVVKKYYNKKQRKERSGLFLNGDAE